MTSKPPIVLMCSQSQFLGVYVGAARGLRQAMGATIHLYTSTDQETRFYKERYPDLFDTVVSANTLYNACKQAVPDPDTAVRRARNFERELGITYNQLAMTDRHLGRGFALGGFYHPRSRISEGTSYDQMVNAYNLLIDFWNTQLDTHRPDVILNPDKVLSVVARHRGIEARTLFVSRVGKYYYWAKNEFQELCDEMGPAEPLTETEEDTEKPYESYLQYRRKFDAQHSLRNVLYKMALKTARFAYWHLRGYEKAKGYYLGEQIRMMWRARRGYKEMTAPSLPGLDDIKDRKFVFFPLATEPETALQALSPEYFFQLSCIASVCRDLPAGYTLVVKEHVTALGRRPRDFYAQIAEFKNAMFMNMNEQGFAVVKHAAAVVTITGTSGLEAAVAGVPAIVFGRRNIYSHLPHVYEITDEVQLKDSLERALATSHTDAAAYGRGFVQQMKRQSFELSDFSPWNPTAITDAEADAAFQSLAETLAPTGAHTAADYESAPGAATA